MNRTSLIENAWKAYLLFNELQHKKIKEGTE
jgi:hypothetical protein